MKVCNRAGDGFLVAVATWLRGGGCRPAPGPNHLPSQGYRRTFPGVKRPERGVSH